MTPAVWRHQSISFSAPFAMGLPLGEHAPVDTVVTFGDTKPTGDDPPGPVLAELKLGGEVFYTVYEAGEQYLVRYHGQCEFWLAEDGSRVICQPAPDWDVGMVPVLMVGTITALLLTLQGYPVVHGSAVCWKGATVLFVGASGQGKTTLAALCCAVGAAFITDDVVPLTEVQGAPACLGLGYELRLREAASEIADLFPSPGLPRRRTADGRLALQPVLADNELNPISAVVLPLPTRGVDVVTTRVVEPSSAVIRLLANGRVPGIVPMSLQRPYFERVADLVAKVPVVEAAVPWGPPFSAAFVPDLLGPLVGKPQRLV